MDMALSTDGGREGKKRAGEEVKEENIMSESAIQGHVDLIQNAPNGCTVMSKQHLMWLYVSGTVLG